MTSDAAVGRTVRVPSGEVRGTPAFRCTVPAAWAEAEVAGALVQMGPRAQPSVVVRVETMRVPADTPLRDLSAASHRRLAQQHPDLAVIVQKAGRFGDRPVWLRGVTLTTGEPATRVAQLHAFFYAPSQPDRALSDVISVLGTCPEAEAAQYVPQFVAIVGSFEFELELTNPTS